LIINSAILAFSFGAEYPLSQILRDYWPVFPVALVVGLIATPFCRRLALRFGVVDYPDNEVKTHARPTAYLGGVGIWVGIMAGLIVGLWCVRNRPAEWRGLTGPLTPGFSGRYPDFVILMGIGFGATIACVLGALDDLVDIKPSQKLIGQALAAAVLLAVGIRPNFALIFETYGLTLPASWDVILGAPIVLFFILGATNSINLLDGLDGLCAGVTVIITIAFAILALTLAAWAYSPVGDPVRLVVCLALAGGVLGFLPMNRHPARIFMGDAGSMLLGFVAGALMLLFTETIGRWSIAAVIIFGLPILDTAVALVRRFINKKPLLVSDRGHIYDQLMDRGMPLKKTVKLCYVLAGFYAIIGLIISQIRFRYAVVVFLLLVVLSGLIVVRGGFLQIPRNTKNPDDQQQETEKD